MTVPDHCVRDRFLRIAADAARILYRAGAQRVWLCGSLAHGNHWDDASDVDYATIGLASAQREVVIAEIEQRVRRHADLICLEDTPSWLRAQITCEMVAVAPDGTVTPGRARPGPIPVVRFNAPSYPHGLHPQRHAVVADILYHRGARRVLDVGCGDATFAVTVITRWPDADIHVHGIDPDPAMISAAADHIDHELNQQLRRCVGLRCAGIGDLPAVWDRHDALAAIEVIEHLDTPTLASFAEMVFHRLRPTTVVLTTPNAEYNALLPRTPTLRGDNLRHPDHRFEWTRDEMRCWLRDTAGRAGYHCALRGVGEAHPDFGSPTQLWTLAIPGRHGHAD